MKTAKIALYAAFCAVAQTCAAGTFNWSGGDGGRWGDPANWQEDAAPSAATDEAVFDIAADVSTDFDLAVSPVIVKRGAGKLTLTGGTYNNTVSTGSVFLYGGSLDLGGGTALIYQPEDVSFDGATSLSGGTTLLNGTFSYVSDKKVQRDSGDSNGASIYWRSGTVTIGQGATLTHPTGKKCQIFEYGPTLPSEKYGLRHLIVDGGTLSLQNGVANQNSRYVIGVNEDWSKGAILEIKNNGRYVDTVNNSTLIIGSRNSGTAGSGKKASGIFVLKDGATATLAGHMTVANDVVSGTYARVSLTNATLTVNGSNGIALSNMSSYNAGSDVAMEINASTVSVRKVTTNARPGTGVAAGLQTGIVILDNGGTLRALQNSTASDPLVKNTLNAANATIRILSGGGAIDTQNYNVALPAVVYGEGSLAKRGTGRLTISGANTFEGVLDVEEGVVELTGSVSGGVAVSGGAFSTAQGGTYPVLRMNGGSASFSQAATFDSVEIGPGGGTLSLGTEGFVFNGVTGVENLPALALDASPAAWSIGEPVLSSDSPAFLEWAAGQLDSALPDGFSVVSENGTIAIQTEVAAKTTTWTGSGADASWATDGNWDSGAPGNGDTVILAGTAKTGTTLDSSVTLPLLLVDQNAGAFSVSGEGSISVSKAITNLSSSALTFNVPVELGGMAEGVHAAGDISFAGGFSAASLHKTGEGTVFLYNDVSGAVLLEQGGIAMKDGAAITSSGAGSVIVGGSLDLGGGSLDMAQPEGAEPNLRDGAAFKNGSVTYTNPTGQGTLSIASGTVTVGEGATLNTTGLLFPIGTLSTAESGARTLVVDGGTVSHASGNIAVAGVNSDWEKRAKLIVRNGGTLSAPDVAIELGGYWSTLQTSAASGEVELDNGTVLSQYFRMGDFPNARHRSLLTLRNGSLVRATRTPQSNANYCGFDTNERGRSDCDAHVLLDHSTIESTRILVKAKKYTGSVDIGRETTGGMQIDGGTLRALFGDWSSAGPWLVNNGNESYPAIELLAGGATIDSQAYSITASAVMYGEGGLEKTGPGTLTISGANTFTGETLVSAGTLAVAAGGALAGPVRVKSGATISVADPATEFASFTLEKGGRVAVPSEYEGNFVDLFAVSGEVVLGETMRSHGRGLFVKHTASGAIVRYGAGFGLQVIVR